MVLSVGSQLGPYEIEAAIGAGGMGEVYQARDTRLDRTVAIKVLPPDVNADPERRARFEREAKAVALLDDPDAHPAHEVLKARIRVQELEGPVDADVREVVVVLAVGPLEPLECGVLVSSSGIPER